MDRRDWGHPPRLDLPLADVRFFLSGPGIFWVFCLALWSLVFGGIVIYAAVDAMNTGKSSGLIPLTVIGFAWIGGVLVFGLFASLCRHARITRRETTAERDARTAPPDPLDEGIGGIVAGLRRVR